MDKGVNDVVSKLFYHSNKKQFQNDSHYQHQQSEPIGIRTNYNKTMSNNYVQNFNTNNNMYWGYPFVAPVIQQLMHSNHQHQNTTAHQHMKGYNAETEFIPNQQFCSLPAPPPRQWLMQQTGESTRKQRKLVQKQTKQFVGGDENTNCCDDFPTLNDEKSLAFTDKVNPLVRAKLNQALEQSNPSKPLTRFSDKQQQQHEFTVVSYNVLCDRMVSKEMFPSSPDLALDWFYRRELILRQLLEFDADIIALQELEMDHYENFFKIQLNQSGYYDSIFEPKSRARTMDCQKRKRVDGCAIFYKSNK